MTDQPRASWAATLRASLRAVVNARRGVVPPRYGRNELSERMEQAIRPGIRVLEAGAGARPLLSPERRPAGCHYVGLDISRSQLERAPAGSYDEVVVCDMVAFDPALAGRFDLVLSLFAMEHVSSVAHALNNLRAYLAPGGRLLLSMSGRFSPFSIANRLLPASVKLPAMERLIDRSADSVFAAHYDRAWHSALEPILAEADWAEWEILPEYSGAHYLRFSGPLQALYIGYEEWLFQRRHAKLATNYLIDARVAP
jgi:SAM-dependent methyltransferase